LSVGTNTITSADFLEIRDREYFHPSESEPVEFLVPTANAERELERLRSGNNVVSDYNVISDYDPIAEFEREIERRPRTLQRLPPTTATPAPSKEKAKPGPKPDFDWEKIEAKCYELMDDNGDFTPDDPDWDCQARLEEALADFCQETWKREPGESTLRDKLPGWLSIWHKRKTGTA
jgi:hypothetical protein